MRNINLILLFFILLFFLSIFPPMAFSSSNLQEKKLDKSHFNIQENDDDFSLEKETIKSLDPALFITITSRSSIAPKGKLNEFAAYYERIYLNESEKYKNYSKIIIKRIINKKENKKRLTFNTAINSRSQIFNLGDCLVLRDKASYGRIFPFLRKKYDEKYILYFRLINKGDTSEHFRVLCLKLKKDKYIYYLTRSTISAMDILPSVHDFSRYLQRLPPSDPDFLPNIENYANAALDSMPQTLTSESLSSSSLFSFLISSSPLALFSSSFAISSISAASSRLSTSSITEVSNSNNKSETKLVSISDFIKASDLPECKTYSSSTSNCLYKNFLKHSIFPLLNLSIKTSSGISTPLKIPVKYQILFEYLASALKKINSLDPVYDFSQINNTYGWIYDLLAGILSVAIPPVYSPEQFTKIAAEVYRKRLPILASDNKVISAHYLVRSGMDAMAAVINACTTGGKKERVAMELGQDARIGCYAQPKMTDKVYYEYEYLVRKVVTANEKCQNTTELAKSAYTFVLGHTSTSISETDEQSFGRLVSAIVNRAKEIRKEYQSKTKYPSHLTVILDNTIEYASPNSTANKLITALSPYIKEGIINLVVTKSLQKFSTLGTGKVRGGMISIFNNGDKIFHECINNLNVFISSPTYQDFMKGAEGQFLMHLLSSNHPYADDLSFVEEASKSAKLVSQIYRNNKGSKKYALNSSGPFLLLPHLSCEIDPVYNTYFNSPETCQVPNSGTFGLFASGQCELVQTTRVSLGMEPPSLLYEMFYVNPLLISLLGPESQTAKQMASIESYKKINGVNYVVINNQVTNFTVEKFYENEFLKQLFAIQARLEVECRWPNTASDTNLFSNAKKASINNLLNNIVKNASLIVFKKYCNNLLHPDLTKVPLPNYYQQLILSGQKVLNACAFSSEATGGPVSREANNNYRQLQETFKNKMQVCSDIQNILMISNNIWQICINNEEPSSMLAPFFKSMLNLVEILNKTSKQ